jgi:hypothetical protein
MGSRSESGAGLNPPPKRLQHLAQSTKADDAEFLCGVERVFSAGLARLRRQDRLDEGRRVAAICNVVERGNRPSAGLRLHPQLIDQISTMVHGPMSVIALRPKWV